MTMSVALDPTTWPIVSNNNSNTSMGNATSNTMHVYHSPVVIACSFAIGIIGIISNGFVLLVIGSSGKMKRRISNTLIANQSLVDLTCSLTLIAYSTVQDTATSKDTWSRLVCEVWLSGGLFWGFLLVSTWNLMVLTLERFASIVYPIWHNNNVNRKKVAVAVVFVWLVPIGQCLLEASLTTDIVDGHCMPYSVWLSQAARVVYGVFILIGYNILPLVCFVVCYTKMALVIREKARRMQPSTTSDSLAVVSSAMVTSVTTTTITATTPLGNVPESSSNSDNGATDGLGPAGGRNNNQIYADKDMAHVNPWSQAKRNILITLAWVSAVYVVCWTPQGVYFFVINMSGKIDFVSDFNNFAILMIYFNCCVNPFVYLAKYDLFRASARALFYSPAIQHQRHQHDTHAPTGGGGSDGT